MPTVGVGARPGQEHIVAGGHDSRLDSGIKDRRRDPAVVAENNGTRLALAGVRSGKLDHDHRVQSLAHDSAQARYAGDPCLAQSVISLGGSSGSMASTAVSPSTPQFDHSRLREQAVDLEKLWLEDD